MLLDGDWQVGILGAGSRPVWDCEVHLVGGKTINRGALVGPQVSSSGTLTLRSASCVRNTVAFGTGDNSGNKVRMGRGAALADSVERQENSKIRAGVDWRPNQCWIAGIAVLRGLTATGQTCPWNTGSPGCSDLDTCWAC
jgi:hypothetical protein